MDPMSKVAASDDGVEIGVVVLSSIGATLVATNRVVVATMCLFSNRIRVLMEELKRASI